MQTIRERKDIDAAYKWKLSDIYASNEAWEADFAAVQKAIDACPALEASLSPTPEAILRCLNAARDMEYILSRLFCYARMQRDEDARVSISQAMADRVSSLAVQASAALAFLRPALLSMPSDVLDLCTNDAAFDTFDRTLYMLRRDQPHTLSRQEEALLAAAGEMGGAPQTIFTMLTDADMRFPAIKDGDGNPLEVSEARFLTLLQNRDGRIRKDAYETVMHTYAGLGNAIAAMYAANVKYDVFSAKSRKFDTARGASLFGNEIPEGVYDALLEAIHERLPALNRYLSLKKKALGEAELHMWDLYVDTVSGFDMKLSYEDGYALIIDALKPLGDAYIRTLQDAKRDGWIDVYENVGKSHGAYSWGCYGVHPYVLMNFEGTLDSVSTLAHELGHAMHSHLSMQKQPFDKNEYTLFAAEVASTVNEILLSCHLLDIHKEPEARRSILGELLEHFRTTVFRQTLFAEFEMETHAMQERGESLTKEALSALYRTINVKYYGEACVVDEANQYEWMRIPHFYRAFYVYQYATGFSAAACIARKIREEGAPAIEGYMQFLQSGGALPPLDALRLAGVDMESKTPVREALAWFESLVAEFEGLC